MLYAIVFSHVTARYTVHAQTCRHARSTSKQYCWVLDEYTTPEAAVEAAHQDERDKGGKAARVKVCNCAKV